MEQRRILVYGVTGAGKTTFAKRLSEKTGLPLHLVDDLAFSENWEPVPDDSLRERIESIVRQEEWILDSAYGKWIDLPLDRAELVLGLDYPRWFSLARLLVRTAKRIITREEICNGNRERLLQALSRRSVILWHFQTFSRKRKRMRRWAELGCPKTVLFESGRQAERWLRGVSACLHCSSVGS